MAEKEQKFCCSWGARTRSVTFTVVAIVLVMAGLFVWLAVTSTQGSLFLSLYLLAAVIVVGLPTLIAAFAPCCYRVTPTHLVVRRLGPNVTIPLHRIEGVEILPPDVFRDTFRAGGGFMGYYGHFYNRKLGHFMAYATRSDRVVVVYTTDGPYALTPDDPEGLVAALTPASDPAE
jgi:hypothetical protein